MSNPQGDAAPALGTPTDAEDVESELELPDDEPTMDTPDELGGTGGEQAGGAG
jgi:hypothetical protein